MGEAVLLCPFQYDNGKEKEPIMSYVLSIEVLYEFTVYLWDHHGFIILFFSMAVVVNYVVFYLYDKVH